MMLDIENLLPKDIIKIINELHTLLEKQENSKSIICSLINKERGNTYCPQCESCHIKKNGKYRGRQLYKCKKCGKKFNELTNTPFQHTRLTYKQIEMAYQCLVDKLPIRKCAKKIGVSTKTAFTLRFKIISCLATARKNVKLKGDMQLDEYYLSINLKGTKKDKMPRASKSRQSNGTSKRGITSHKICVVSGVDEFDNMYFEVVGTGSITSMMIKNSIANKINDSKKVVTDCKSSYESIAKENNWNLIQIKSGTYTNENGDNLSNINSLHSELELFLSKFRGVSTKHLQEYLDWFVFSKYQDYCVDYLEQSDDFEKKTITKQTKIKYSNVCNNYSVINFSEVYKDYNYQTLNCTT